MNKRRRALAIAIVAIIIVIAAIIILYPHQFEATSEGNGKVSPSDGTVRFYEGFEITAIPDEGWHIGHVELDGNPIDFDGSEMKFRVSAFDFSVHRINVVFVPDTEVHIVTVTHTSGGSVEPSGTVSVSDGDSVTIEIHPDEGYFLSSLTINGTIVASDIDTYTISNITEDLDVHALFTPTVSPELHILTITHTSGGTVTPSGTVTVEDGGSVTLSISPSSGYRLSSLRVDGTHVASGIMTYTISDITENHTVHAIFASTGGGSDSARLVSVEVTTNPNRTVYSVGDAFDPTGMVVTAYYSDGSNKTLSLNEYSYSPSGPLTENDDSVTVSYRGFSDTVNIVVAEPSDFTVTVTQYSGTRVVDGIIMSFDENPEIALSAFTFDTQGIVPGISQTAVLEITNGSAIALDAFVYIDDPRLDGNELAQQVSLSVTSSGSTVSCSISEIVAGNLMTLGTVEPGETIEVTVTLSFPHSEDNNDAMGQSIGFGLGIFALEHEDSIR